MIYCLVSRRVEANINSRDDMNPGDDHAMGVGGYSTIPGGSGMFLLLTEIEDKQ